MLIGCIIKWVQYMYMFTLENIIIIQSRSFILNLKYILYFLFHQSIDHQPRAATFSFYPWNIWRRCLPYVIKLIWIFDHVRILTTYLVLACEIQVKNAANAARRLHGKNNKILILLNRICLSMCIVVPVLAVRISTVVKGQNSQD